MASSNSGITIPAPGTLPFLVFFFYTNTLQFSIRLILLLFPLFNFKIFFGFLGAFISTEAVQVLVSLLADESPIVRAAASASLKDIAALYLPLSLSLSLYV